MNPNQAATQPSTPIPIAQAPLANTPLSQNNSPSFLSRVASSIIVRIIFVVLLLILISIGAALAITVYTDIKLPLLSEQKKDLTLIFYKIPFIPKNPEQILVTAVDKNTRLKSYTPNFSFNAQLRTSDIEVASVDLQVDGPVDITDEKNILFSVNTKAALNYGGHSYQIEGKIINKDKALYGKIDKLPAELVNMYSGMGYGGTSQATPQTEIQSNLEELFKNWIKYELKNIPTEARQELEKNIQSTSITNTIREEAQSFLLKSSILPEVKKLKDEKIEGVDCYHLVLSPNKEKTKEIILEYVSQHKTLQKEEYKKATDALAGSFEQLHLEMWVGKADAIVRKTSMQTQMDLGFIPSLLYPAGTKSSSYDQNILGLGDLGKAKLAFSTVLILKDVNKPVTITIPPKTVTVEEYFKLFSDSFTTKAQKEQEAKEQSLNSDMDELNQSLTRYYVNHGQFPTALSDLRGEAISITSGLATRLDTYKYRRGTNTNKFIVYITNSTSYSVDSSPYYGITSTYAYAHQLTAKEFAEINQ